MIAACVRGGGLSNFYYIYSSTSSSTLFVTVHTVYGCCFPVFSPLQAVPCVSSYVCHLCGACGPSCDENVMEHMSGEHFELS